MSIRYRISAFIQKYFAWLCVVSVLLGLIVGESAACLAHTIPWMLGLLMFSSGLGFRLRDLAVLRQKPWLLPLILLLFHVIMPLIALGAGTVLGFHVGAVIGFVILTLVPISATAAVWTGLNRGNLTLSMAIILVDTIVTPFFIPYILAFFFGTEVAMDPVRMLRGLFWMLFFPTLLAILCNRATGGGLQRAAGKPIAFLSQLAVFALLFVNGGVVAPFARDFNLMFFLVFGMTFALSTFWYLFTYAAGRVLFTDKGDVLALMFTGSLRSSTTGMVIAVAYFPPLTALVMVFCMFFQQAMGAWYGKFAADRLMKAEGGLPRA